MKNLRWKLLYYVLLAMTVLQCSRPAQSRSAQLLHTFQQAIPEAGDLFGTSVVLEGNVAGIKSHSGYLDGDGLSVTHIFEQTPSGEWAETATLEFNAGDNDGNFFIGQELAIDDGEVVIGYGPHSIGGSSRPLQFAKREASGWSVQFSEAPPFRRDTPPEERLASSDLRPAGRVVDISQGYAIAEEAGARRRVSGGVGVARIYARQLDSSWLEVANLVPERFIQPGMPSVDATILSVALDGTTAALVDRGAQPDRIAGGLYFFERQPTGDWVEAASFLAPENQGFFSRLVELDGDVAVLRSFSVDSALVYERDPVAGWQQSAELEAASRTSAIAMAIDGDLLALSVDTPVDMGGGRHVEVYRRHEFGDWRLLDSITDPGTTDAVDFGSSLALDGNRLLVGASLATFGNLPDSPGAAYLFQIVPEPASLVLLLLFSVMSQGRRELRTS